MSSYNSSFNGTIDLDYPAYLPDINLDFNNNRNIPSEFSYTRNGSATYTDSNGIIRTAGINQPRFNYDFNTKQYKGLLIEESRTNWITNYSNGSFSMAYSNWVPDNSTTYPDGTTNGCYNIFNQLSGARFFLDFSAAGNVIYTISVYAKYKRYSPVTSFDLTIKNWVSDTIVATNGFTLTDNWQRYSTTAEITTYGSTAGLRYEIFTNAAGDNAHGYFWGAQVEVGSSLTSYIPTPTGVVTRQADQLTITRPFNSFGTFFVESDAPDLGSPLAVDNGTNILPIAPADTITTKNVLYYNTNRTLSMSSSGVPMQETFAAPINLNRASVGFDRLNNSNYINGHIKKFMYYPSVITEDNLKTLTGSTRNIYREDGQIVTDSLLLNYDISNPNCYSGGSSIVNLVNNTSNVSYAGNPRYSTTNGGFVRNPLFETSIVRPSPSTTPTTYELVFKNNSTRGFIGLIGSSDYQSRGFSFGFFGKTQMSMTYNAPGQAYENPLSYDSSTISHGIFVFNGRNISAYRNGTFIVTYTAPFDSADQPNTVLLGANRQGGWGRVIGDIYLTRIYGKALSATEITQNFNAIRGRYDL